MNIQRSIFPVACIAMLFLLTGCATTEDLTKLEKNMGARLQTVENRMQQSEKQGSDYGTRIKNLEDFKTAQEVANASMKQIRDQIDNLSRLDNRVKALEDKVRVMDGLTDDFFTRTSQFRTEMNAIRVHLDQTLSALVNRLKTERDAIDQAISRMEADVGSRGTTR